MPPRRSRCRSRSRRGDHGRRVVDSPTEMKVVKPGPDREVPRGVVGGAEISQATAGARNIYMALFRVPPGARPRPHYHEGCESAVYMLSGSLEVKWGDHLEHQLTLEPGDLVYVPPRETHVLANTSPTPSPPSTWWPATRRTRTRSWCRGPSGRDRAPGVVVRRRRRRRDLPPRVAARGRAERGGGDRPRRRRAQRALRPRRRQVRARGLRRVRDRPPRPRPLAGPPGADRPDRQRRRRPRQADLDCGRHASPGAVVPARPQHRRHDRRVLRAGPSGPAGGPDPERPAGGDRPGRCADPPGRDGAVEDRPAGAARSRSTPRWSAATRRWWRPTGATRSSTTASSRCAPWPSWPP